MTKRNSRRRTAPVLVGAVILGLGAVTGCSTDTEPDSPTSAPSTTSTPSEASSGSPSDTPTPTTPTPTPSASPTVEPAAGPELVATNLGDPLLTFRAPTEGSWTVRKAVGAATSVSPEGELYSLGGRSFPVVLGKDFAYYSGLTRRSAAPGLELDRSDNRVVDGIEGYVLEGTSGGTYYYYFGTIYEDLLVDVFFRLPRDDAATHALIDSVLASATWV